MKLLLHHLTVLLLREALKSWHTGPIHLHRLACILPRYLIVGDLERDCINIRPQSPALGLGLIYSNVEMRFPQVLNLLNNNGQLG